MSPEINAGIIELARKGCLTATSCMSRGKAFRQAAPLLAELPIEKGLHLNLTESLDGNAFFQPLPRLILSCYARQIDPGVIKSEIEYQLDAFESAFERAPHYVDGHQHVHQLPIVRDCLIEILLRRYGEQLPWLRSTLRPKQPVRPQTKAALIEFLGARALQTSANRHGFKTNHRFLGIYGFKGGEPGYFKLLDAWIRAAAPNDLIMCHPALGPDSADSLNRQRRAEYAILSSASLRDLLEQHQAFVAKHLSV